MSENKNKVTVEIYGLQYKLSGHASSGQMLRVAGIVDDQMNKIAKGFPRLDTTRVAVLAAVNIADDYLKLKEQLESRSNDARLNLNEEQQELMRLNTELQHKNEQQIEQLKDADKRADELKTQMDKLQEEYSKLQTEYNEWIQLIQSEPS
jgi:cell division protein ZapA (FtsZ GTPase activity inhibitor)